MALMRWEPFRDALALQERMNKLFADVFSRRGLLEEESVVGGTWVPAVDIYETDNDIILKAELPGMKQEDIHLEIRENVLTLKGERRQEEHVKEGRYQRVERSFGTFQRLFTLPNAIQQDKVKAKYKDGILEVIMPKIEVAKSKHIAIES